MNAMRMRQEAAVLLAAAVLLGSTGCRIEKTYTSNGKDVKIDTPFGGMSVKTDGKEVQALVGLDVYPGATPEKKSGDDDKAANVNMNFGGFHLGVKAASYTTPDAPAKVMQFYRGQLARYGTVIECRGSSPVGTPVVTSAGLSCDEEKHSHVHVTDGDDLELKAGSKAHEHIVGVNPQGSGTKFGLVMLDLPQGLGSDGNDKQ